MSSLKVRVEKKMLERAAYLLKCMAHPMRLGIIDLLEQRERLTVSQLQEALQIEQSLLSHHLTNMRAKGILATHREGKYIYYFLNDTAISDILTCVHRIKGFRATDQP